MYFYVLVPPSGTSPPSLGYFDPIPHPDAALPFIEIIVPNVSEETTATFDMAAGGQVSLLFVDDDLDTEEVYVGVWDWKNGVCLGVSDLFVWLNMGLTRSRALCPIWIQPWRSRAMRIWVHS